MTTSASFDVIGTCFEFSAPIEAIQARLGTMFKTVANDATTLFFSWFYAAQRDFTYVSLAGEYKPIADILNLTLRRACRVVDLPADAVSDEDIEEIMKAFRAMKPRDGLKQCFDGLRKNGWDIYGVTNGGVETSLNYYHAAGVDLDKDHLLSCNDLKVAKPDPRVYERANVHLTSRGLGKEGDGDRWYVAAHAWDLIAARKAGFKTAYLDFEEHDPVTGIFGGFDMYVSSMDELLSKLSAIANN